MQYKYINHDNKEQLCLLGRAILNDLLIQNQRNIKIVFEEIKNQLTKQLLDFKTKKENLSQVFLENIKISLKPFIEQLIIDFNKYDDQKNITINALSEYIIDQNFIVPYYLLEENRSFNINGKTALHDYYNQTGQTWFINYHISIAEYDTSLSLDKEIENIINKLLTINKLIYPIEVAHKLEHIPLPKINIINNLIDKLNRMITIKACDGKRSYVYNKHEAVISELISILEYVQQEYEGLKEYMLENNITNILQIPLIAKKVPEYINILTEKLPITIEELNSIFDPESSYKNLADIYYNEYYYLISNSCLNAEKLKEIKLEKIILRTKNILCLNERELFLARFYLKDLLENCIKVQCDINETELSSSLDFFRQKLEAGSQKYENQLSQNFEQKLLNFEQSKQLLQQKKIIISEEYQNRNILEKTSNDALSSWLLQFNVEKSRIRSQETEYQNRNILEKAYNDDLSMLILQFNSEKSKIESQQQKEKLIKKLIVNPLSLDNISKDSKDGRSIITITFDFIDLEGVQRCLQLNECQCQEKFQRKQFSEIEDYRLKMECNIVKSILDNVINKAEQINLVCIGSDLFGLTIILAKLYKEGYTQFNIFNIEKKINHVDTIVSMKKSKEIKRLDENCKKFWEWLFSNNQNNLKSTIKFATIFNYNACIFGNETIQNKKIFLFAEDLSSMNYASQYNSVITDFAKEIHKNNPSLEVFLTQFDTKVSELETLFTGINSQFKIRNSM